MSEKWLILLGGAGIAAFVIAVVVILLLRRMQRARKIVVPAFVTPASSPPPEPVGEMRAAPPPPAAAPPFQPELATRLARLESIVGGLSETIRTQQRDDGLAERVARLERDLGKRIDDLTGLASGLPPAEPLPRLPEDRVAAVTSAVADIRRTLGG